MNDRGFSLIEVMVAMVIMAFGLMGVMGMFQWAEQGLQYGANGARALAMAESRLEAKRTMPWDALLRDDMDADGIAEITMLDNGEGADERAGDGMYTASAERDGIRLVWTVQPNRPTRLSEAGSAVIFVHAGFPVGPGQRRELSLGTIRANPRFVGGH